MMTNVWMQQGSRPRAGFRRALSAAVVTRAVSWVLASAALLPWPCAAQAGAPASADPTGISGLLEQTVIVERQAGGARMLGSSWHAELGDRIDVGVPGGDEGLALSVLSVGREGSHFGASLEAGSWTETVLGSEPARWSDSDLQLGLHSSWSRPVAPLVREHAVARAGGLELSYSFAERPFGAGDLVVRLAVDTDLEAPIGRYPAQGLTFESYSGGRVGGLTGADVSDAIHVGAVLGIDADGRKEPGELRWDGAHLDLVLSADFVDNAAYPLLLDPLIGSVVTLSTDPFDSHPDIAHIEGLNLWGLAWNRQVNKTTHVAGFQLLDNSFAPIGAPLQLGTSTTNTEPVLVSTYSQFRYAYKTGTAVHVGTVTHQGNLGGEAVRSAPSGVESFDYGSAYSIYSRLTVAHGDGRVVTEWVTHNPFSIGPPANFWETTLLFDPSDDPGGRAGTGVRMAQKTNDVGQAAVLFLRPTGPAASDQNELCATVFFTGQLQQMVVPTFTTGATHGNIGCTRTAQGWAFSYSESTPSGDRVLLMELVRVGSGNSTYALSGPHVVANVALPERVTSTNIQSNGIGYAVVWQETRDTASSTFSELWLREYDLAFAPCGTVALIGNGERFDRIELARTSSAFIPHATKVLRMVTSGIVSTTTLTSSKPTSGRRMFALGIQYCP